MSPQPSFLKRQRVLAAAVILTLLLGFFLWNRRSQPRKEVATFAARRGPLLIAVLEGGSVEARQAQEIRSEIKGYQGTKILSIVEEGYYVTEEDVKKKKVLVELDSSELQQRIIQQDIQYQNALAAFINAQQDLEIQINQNQSDIKLAEQRAKFALMDLEKYMGDQATKEILTRVGLPYDLSTNGTFSTGQDLLDDTALLNLTLGKSAGIGKTNQMAESVLASAPVLSLTASNLWQELLPAEPQITALQSGSSTNGSAKPPVSSLTFDFTEYVDEAKLGDGAAKQNLRKLEDDVLVAKTDLNVAMTKLEGTRRLFEKEFVTKTEQDNDEISVKKNELRVKTAETALQLFKKYEFAKAAEEALSRYEEALQSLDRTGKQAISRLAQAQARFRSAEGQFRVQDQQRKELNEQQAKCVIRAEQAGLVVYGSARNQRYYNSDEQIREGVTVRERQTIITIPDTTQMSVGVRIPESHIKKIRKGMKARITVEAFPDEPLIGEVTKVGVLPDSQDRYMNPDLKVYLTTITIEGAHEWLKPGMNARVEIEVKQLEDVVYVPLQAVSRADGKYHCYVGKSSPGETREVQIGDFNDEFIVIKGGLREGEVVQLRSLEARLSDEENSGEETETSGSQHEPVAPAKNSPAVAAPGNSGR